MAVFTRAETQKVEEAITALEKRTAGEVVVATLQQAGDYRFYRAVIGALIGVGIAGGFGIFFPMWPSSLVLAGAMVIGWLSYSLNEGLILGVIRKSGEAAVHAEKAAFRLFSSRGVYRTRDQSGVLILLAEKERQVVILGDEGIDRVLPVGSWESYVKRLTGAISRGEAATELLRVLEELGDLLAEHFPVGEEDTNELSNQVVTE